MLEAGKRNATDTQNLSSGVKDMRNSLNKSAFRLISASYIDGFMVHLEFQDGKEFDLDLGKDLNSIRGPLVDPLKDKNVFSKLRVEYGALVFPTGLDYGGDVLRLWCENGTVADQQQTDKLAEQYCLQNSQSCCAA